MFAGMADNRPQRPIRSDKVRDNEVDDWLAARGGIVFGVIIVALIVWGVVSKVIA